MHDDMTMATLRSQADGILEVKTEDEEDGLHRYFRVSQLED
jgi:hypothetical protein